ncbi:hypothetical protein COX24_01385 [bacterium (Candidatus Gribaldobacteria) CG23_combo_of_CG06-09_8_20_14_all_37_87_8]|uniref:Uncharacterized protein n=2 Tax=Bacteria candidate phyla TaxID=1783234 RepID=A0A2H0TLU1_9BACT|nr:MAG: hypothetical protein COX24_01385 [bacterium (Candidatus Gribaldobacteria) CG23_combo_of_CG06-09_8_20_14_all_37_87_8]PIR73132.1 MAG: hypothetical protein COV26_00070 [Candidatus Nealsonbacteria bacterium CG10_big_fil_rev_8_21_14_0_10_36_23]
MSRTLNLIYAFLVFWATLFLYQAIFPALFALLVFLGGLFLIDHLGKYCCFFSFTGAGKQVVEVVFSGFGGIVLFCLVFLPVEFIISEVKYITPKLPDCLSLGVLLFFVLIFSFFPWKKFYRKKLFYFSFLFFLLLAGTVALKYKSEKLEREYLPKIYSLSPRKVIQAQIITVKGANFGPVWKKGKLVYGEEDKEIVIKDWSERMILAEQPVPSSFGKFQLTVLRSDGVRSNPLDFEIINPDTLLKQ